MIVQGAKAPAPQGVIYTIPQKGGVVNMKKDISKLIFHGFVLIALLAVLVFGGIGIINYIF